MIVQIIFQCKIKVKILFFISVGLCCSTVSTVKTAFMRIRVLIHSMKFLQCFFFVSISFLSDFACNPYVMSLAGVPCYYLNILKHHRNFNPGQNIWHKVNISSRIEQDFKNLLPNFVFFDSYCQSLISGRKTRH